MKFLKFWALILAISLLVAFFICTIRQFEPLKLHLTGIHNGNKLFSLALGTMKTIDYLKCEREIKEKTNASIYLISQKERNQNRMKRNHIHMWGLNWLNYSTLET